MSMLNKPVFQNSIITPFDNTVAIEVGERNYQMNQDRMRLNTQSYTPAYKPEIVNPLPKTDYSTMLERAKQTTLPLRLRDDSLVSRVNKRYSWD